MAKVMNADVVCWATPIYYYEMSGQMKTLIDRMNAMYSQNYLFRDVYLLTTAAEEEEATPKRAETGLTGWIDCYPKSRLAGTLFCGGVNDAREIEGNPKLQEAFHPSKPSSRRVIFPLISIDSARPARISARTRIQPPG